MHDKPSPRWYIYALQTGLVGGIITVLVCLVGMVEAFDERDIIAGLVTMGQTTLFLIIFAASYYSCSQLAGVKNALRLVSGALTGLTTGALLAGLVLLGKAVNLRQVLVNASPELYKIVTFGLDNTATAVIYLLLAGAVIGLMAALIYILPPNIRRAAISGLTLVLLIGLLQDLIRITLVPFPKITKAAAWLFGTKGQLGISGIGALAVFLVVGGLNYLGAVRGASIQGRMRALPPTIQRSIRWGSWLLLILGLLIWPRLSGAYLSEVTNNVGLFILMGLGLNIVVGYAGLLDLGYVAFFALGAYSMAVLTTTGGEIATHLEWSFWQALPVAVFVALMAGVILGIPVLKIRGDYLAIITLGFGEITRILFLSDFLKPYFGGSLGIVLVAKPQIGSLTLDSPQTLYYLILGGCLLVIFISWRLRDSRIGRAWKAVREDEDVAQAMGINLTTTKLLAFAMGAAFGGLSGAIFASKLSTVYPSSFVLLVSINVLALIIVGGMGSIPGVVVGGLLLVGLPELLREFSEYRLLMYGALLIVMMITKPEGFWPEAVHRREFHEEENPVESATGAK